MSDQFCMICLKESVRGEIDRLKLCKECLIKIGKYWNENEVKKY